MTAVLKNVYIDKLNYIVNEYNNTQQLTWSLLMLKIFIYIIYKLILIKKFVIKTLNSKLVIMLEYQNKKIFLLKDILQIGLRGFCD